MDNFDLKKYLVENRTPIQEGDFETTARILMTSALALVAFSPLIVNGMESLKDVIKSNFQEWKRNKEVQKISSKLQQDPEIQEFLNLPPDQQKGKWRKLVASKLTDEELKHLRSISRQMVKNKNNE